MIIFIIKLEVIFKIILMLSIFGCSNIFIGQKIFEPNFLRTFSQEQKTYEQQKEFKIDYILV